MTARLFTWNVNGIRAASRRGFADTFASLKPDILALQEVKALPEEFPLLPETYSDYQLYWHAAEKRGYSGTAVLTKYKPLAVRYGLAPGLDREGRVLTLEFPGCYFVNVYTPNSKRGLLRLEYRIREWDPAFRAYLSELQAHKPVMFCGDLNVAHQDIDIANPKGNVKNAGFTPEERTSFSETLELGFMDVFRKFNREPHQYTWWSARPGVRERNIGWRIDYFCATRELATQIHDVKIHSHILGSDHCPVSIDVDRKLLK